MKKKVIATLAAAAMAVSLMACGSSNAATEAVSEAASEVAAEAETTVEEVESIADAAAEAATSDAEETAAAEVEVAVDGFCLDATANNFTLLTTDGEVITYVSDDLATLIDGGLEVAHNYELTTDGENILTITCTDNVMMNKDYDALQLAAQVVLAVNNEDISYLSELCEYPLTVDGDMVYETAEDLAAAEFGSVVTPELRNAVLTSGLYYADMDPGDFSISPEGTAPEIVISNTADTTWAVTAINN